MNLLAASQNKNDVPREQLAFSTFKEIVEPLLRHCDAVLDQRNDPKKATGEYVIDRITHPNLAYLKFLSIDILFPFVELYKHDFLFIYEKAASYGNSLGLTLNHKTTYVGSLIRIYAQKAQLDDKQENVREKIAASFSHYPLGLGKSGVYYLSSLIPTIKRLAALEKGEDAMRIGLYMTYLISSVHPSERWILQDFSTTKQTIEAVLDPAIKLNKQPLAQMIRSINVVIGKNVLQQLLELKYSSMNSPELLKEFIDGLLFEMHILHMKNIQTICRSYASSEYGERFVEMAQVVDTYTNALVEWKLTP